MEGRRFGLVWVSFVFLVCIMSGCATEWKSAPPISQGDIDLLRQTMPRAKKEERWEKPEGTDEYFRNEPSPPEWIKEGEKERSELASSGESRLSDLEIEDFLHLDKPALAGGARQGKYPFYYGGDFIYGTLVIPLKVILGGMKIRLVTPFLKERRRRLEEVHQEGGAWGIVGEIRY